MASDDFAEGGENQIAVFVYDHVEGIDFADHANNLKLFLMQRVANQIALDSQRILHESRRVKDRADEHVACHTAYGIEIDGNHELGSLIYGDYVWALRNDRDRRVTMACYAVGDRMVDRID